MLRCKQDQQKSKFSEPAGHLATRYADGEIDRGSWQEPNPLSLKEPATWPSLYSIGDLWLAPLGIISEPPLLRKIALWTIGGICSIVWVAWVAGFFVFTF